MEKIGKVTRFFDRIMVAVIILEKELKTGDEINIKGETTDLKQRIESMEIDREKIDSAKEGDEIAIKINEKVRINDLVYKI